MALVIKFDAGLQRGQFNGEKDYIINEKETINSVRYSYNVIKNVKFRKGVVFEKFDLDSGLKFVNCEFEEGIYFLDVQCSNHELEINHTGHSVVFDNCKLSEVTFQTIDFIRTVTTLLSR